MATTDSPPAPPLTGAVDTATVAPRPARLPVDLVDPGLRQRLVAGLAAVEHHLRTCVVRPDDAFLSETASYLLRAGGKRFRPLLALLGAEFGDPATPGVVVAGAVVELAHVASLYHDDVMDEAPLRHGVQSAGARWSNTVAILTGDYLLARAAEIGVSLGADVIRLQTHAVDRLVRGQIRETVGPGPGEDPAAHVLAVIADKSAALIALSAQLGATVAGADEPVVAALTRGAEALGTAFQLSDDVLDIMSDATVSGKTPGTDLREGVLTMPLLYAQRSPHRQDARLRALLRSGPLTDDALHAEALTLLRRSPAMGRARADIATSAASARASFAELPDCAARDALQSLCAYVVTRTS